MVILSSTQGSDPISSKIKRKKLKRISQKHLIKYLRYVIIIERQKTDVQEKINKK